MSDFAQNLEQLRNKRRITRQELAKSVGVSEGAIWLYEHGLITPKIQIAVAIAKRLGTTCEALLYGEGKEV